MTDRKRPSLLLNALSNWATLAINSAANFLLTPFLLYHLGKTGYGTWMLVTSLVASSGLVDLGVRSAVTRYVARYAGQDNHEDLNKTVSTAFTLFCVIGFLIVLASLAFSGWLAHFMAIPAEAEMEFRYVLMVLALATGVALPGNVLGTVIRAHERFTLANTVDIIAVAVRTGMVVFLVSRGLGLSGIAWSNLASILVMVILNYVFFRRVLPSCKGLIQGCSRRTLRILLLFGIPSTTATVADIMRFHLDSVVIGKLIGLESVAVFGVAAFIVTLYVSVVYSGTQLVFTPRYSALDGEGNHILLEEMFLKSLSISAALSFGIATLILTYGNRFILLWVGSGFADAVPILWVLVAGYSIALAQSPGIALVYALNKHYLLAIASVVEGLLNLALSIYLARSYGILGVAIGTAAPMLLVKIIAQPVYVTRIIGITLTQYWSKIVPALALAIAFVLLGRYIPDMKFGSNAYFNLMVYGTLQAAAFFVLCLLGNAILAKWRMQERF